MALNFNNFEVALQSKLDTITEQKDMLLLGKAIEATVGNVAVSDLQAEGTTQTSAVQAEGSTQVSAVQAQGTSERNQINAMSSQFAHSANLHDVATSGNFNSLINKPNPFDPSTLHTVATNGDYNSLSNKPTIPTPGKLLNVASAYSDDFGNYSNQSTHLNCPINISSSSSKLYISGVLMGECQDDNNVFLEYRKGTGAWTRDALLNSRARTYSGIGEMGMSALSNGGPQPVVLDSIFSPNYVGTVEIRVYMDVEASSTYYKNRSHQAVDNSENFGTSRSRIILMEVGA